MRRLNNLTLICLTRCNGYYWTEIRISKPAVLLAACIIDIHHPVVDSHSLDYNPEWNLQMIIKLNTLIIIKLNNRL